MSLLSFCLVFLNFFLQTFEQAYNNIDLMINRCLDKKVIYYALYSKQDNFLACLYDCRNFSDRLWLALQQLMVWLKLDTDTLFTYVDVDKNFEHLSDYSINAAIISYIDNGIIKEKLLLQRVENIDNSLHTSKQFDFNYIYCIAEDENGYCVDMTAYFNKFKHEVLQNKHLVCKDFVKIFADYAKHPFHIQRLKVLKVMMDDTFTEVLFKDNDIIVHQ